MKKPSSKESRVNASVTLHDVARKVGVSHVTVWRALRHSPKVPEARRQEIERVAAEMGYRPNPAASALVQFRTASKTKPIQATFAWLNFWPDPRRLREEALFDSQWHGAVKAAEVLGYRIEEFICDGDLAPAKLKRILSARGIQGILLPPQRPPVLKEHYDFDWSRFAAIRLGHTVPYPKTHLVTFAQAANTVEALGSMHRLGYRRIGHVTGRTIHDYGLFVAGYMKQRATWLDKDQIPVLVLDDPSDARPAKIEAIRSWMETHRPDAILSTEGTIKSLLEAAGYRVPEDVAVAATSISASDVDAGILEHPEEVGRVAGNNLAGLIQLVINCVN